MPGTVRSASAKVVTFFSLSTSSGITVTERGVSMSGAVNLYEGSVFTCMSDGAEMTLTAGSVLSAADEAGAGVSVAAVCDQAAGAKKPEQYKAATDAMACIRVGRSTGMVSVLVEGG
jgi:hypothetical protein